MSKLLIPIGAKVVRDDQRGAIKTEIVSEGSGIVIKTDDLALRIAELEAKFPQDSTVISIAGLEQYGFEPIVKLKRGGILR